MQPDPTSPSPGAAPTPGAAYYAEGLRVWKAPVHHPVTNGVERIEIGFHACTAMEIVGEEGAKAIASLLCRGERFEDLAAQVSALTDALRGMVRLWQVGGVDIPDRDLPPDVIAALSSARSTLAAIDSARTEVRS